MNPKRYIFTSVFALAALLTAGHALAGTPVATSVVVQTRVFDDCGTSTVNVVDNDFAGIIIDDIFPAGCGGLNRHAWHLSADNASPIAWENGDQFSFCATIRATGTANGEIGLRLSPWWSPNVDGVFMLNTASGEIAIFGGRLPFYSFTNPPHSQTYVKGTTVTLSMDYKPNGLSAANPATVEYRLTNLNGTFSSGPRPFDEGNPAEGHGSWGALTPSRAGGYIQSPTSIPGNFRGEWTNICFDSTPTPTAPSTWGRIKADYR